jgi:hypothetical protein
MIPLQQALRSATLADSTEEMGRHASDAMAIVDDVLQMLRPGGRETEDSRRDAADPQLVRAAERALTQAWDRAEKVSLAGSVVDMRARVLDFKTFADFADAYLSASLGSER